MNDNANYNHVIFEDNKVALQDIESKSVNLILTDPPYLISRDSSFQVGNKMDKYKSLSNDFGSLPSPSSGSADGSASG